jgi:hypothetical protein
VEVVGEAEAARQRRRGGETEAARLRRRRGGGEAVEAEEAEEAEESARTIQYTGAFRSWIDTELKGEVIQGILLQKMALNGVRGVRPRSPPCHVLCP